MEPIWDWGNQLIFAIQTIHTPFLDAFFNGITLLGETEFYLLLFPLIIWTLDKSTGLKLAYLVMMSITCNTWAKFLINHPRPYAWPSPHTSPILKLNPRAAGPGIPSGHTQTSLVLWFYLAWTLKRRWFWWLAAVLFGLVSFSRLYLGVHFPTDLLGGAALGFILLWGFIRFEPALTAALAARPRKLLVALALLVPGLAAAVFPHPDIVAAMSTTAGFSLGAIFDSAALHYRPAGSIGRRLFHFVVGLALLLIIFEGLASLAPPGVWHLPMRVIRYIAAGFWVTGGAPWLFIRLRR